MGRKRVIDTDELLFDEELYELIGDKGLWVYVRLWSLAEDWGGYEPKYGSIALKMGVLKMSTEEIRSTITKLISVGKIITYRIPGLHNTEFHWIKNLLKHQPLNNPAPPNLPLPPWITCEIKEYASKKKYASYRIDLEKLASYTSSLPVEYPYPTGSPRNETKRNETETRKALSAEPTTSLQISPKELSEIWNRHAPKYLSRVNSMSDKRAKKLKHSMNSFNDPAWWTRLFQDIDLSDFYSGKDGKWTGMDFDWAILNCEKLRGKLDRATHNCSPLPRDDPKDPFNGPGLLKLDPNCPLCHGDWRNSKEPCSCLHPVEDDDAKPEPKRTAPPATC